MLPVLKKPFETSAILTIMKELKLGHPASMAARVELDEALRNSWIEFWYQPKIDLRKKQLAGVEAFARCRHPQFGILPPGAFMPGATESELLALSEHALGQRAADRTEFLAARHQSALRGQHPGQLRWSSCRSRTSCVPTANRSTTGRG